MFVKLSTLESSSVDLLIFLNNINNNIPIENSKPAKPIIKKLVDNKFKSSLLAPHKIV
jgi:hypothetical protein